MMIAIDPSINDIGWAIFDNSELEKFSGISTRGKEVNEKLMYLFNEIKYIIKQYPVFELVIEIPNYWTIDRARKRDMFTLFQAIGVIKASFISIQLSSKIYDLKVSDWKGHKSKGETKFEMSSLYSLGKDLKSHVYDAVGLGHYWLSQQKLEGAIDASETIQEQKKKLPESRGKGCSGSKD